MGPSNGCCRLLLLVAVAVAGAAVDSAAAQQQQGAPSGPGPNYFDPKNFNPSMAIVMVVLVTAFFLLGFFSIYLRRCAGPPLGGADEYPGAGRRPGVGGIAFASSRSRRMGGLDRAVLESFPTMAYADVKAHNHKAGKGALECAVCLSEFDDDETLRLLPRCSHAFHADCIDAWLASHVTCPVCRAVLLPDAEPPAGAAVSATEQDAPSSPQQAVPETATTAAPEQAVVVVADAEQETEEERIRREEAAELMRIGRMKRALRSKSGRRPAQFPRSHTTGHSLATAAADAASERYTLRLPEHVLREVVAAAKLRRSASVQAFWTGGGDGSTRRGVGGARGGRSVRLGQSGRWPNMSLLARTFSARMPAWGSVRRGEADGAPAKGAKVAGDGKAVEQCDGGVCPLGDRV